MFGKIIKIDGNLVIINNNNKETHSEYMNCHVVFEEIGRKVVGEIIKISDEEINILLIC